MAAAKFALDQTVARSISISHACSTYASDVLHQPAERLRTAIACTNHTGARNSSQPPLGDEGTEKIDSKDPKPT